MPWQCTTLNEKKLWGQFSGVLCVGVIGLASMHAADSGCKLGLIGALRAVMSVWWTPSGTMLLSVSAGLMSVGGLIGFLRQSTLR